jgi:hypothetical protein
MRHALAGRVGRCRDGAVDEGTPPAKAMWTSPLVVQRDGRAPRTRIGIREGGTVQVAFARR